MTTYRIDPSQTDGLMGAIDNAGIDLTNKQRARIFDAIRTALVPDTRLQTIADAWNELPGVQYDAVRIAAGKLVAAIEDALTEDDER